VSSPATAGRVVGGFVRCSKVILIRDFDAFYQKVIIPSPLKKGY
jgi:hypothetical protein